MKQDVMWKMIMTRQQSMHDYMCEQCARSIYDNRIIDNWVKQSISVIPLGIVSENKKNSNTVLENSITVFNY
jgi:hypothetical protein